MNQRSRRVVIYKHDIDKLDYDNRESDWGYEYYNTLSNFNNDPKEMLYYIYKYNERTYTSVSFSPRDILEDFSHTSGFSKHRLWNFGDIISIDDVFYFIDGVDGSLVEMGAFSMKEIEEYHKKVIGRR